MVLHPRIIETIDAVKAEMIGMQVNLKVFVSQHMGVGEPVRMAIFYENRLDALLKLLDEIRNGKIGKAIAAERMISGLEEFSKKQIKKIPDTDKNLKTYFEERIKNFVALKNQIISLRENL